MDIPTKAPANTSIKKCCTKYILAAATKAAKTVSNIDMYLCLNFNAKNTAIQKEYAV